MEAVLGRQSGTPRGLVRLGTSVAGEMFLATRLPVLLARYPGLSVELVMRDQHTDMIEERLDLAFRSGDIADASLVARRVGNLGRAVVAAPIYLERYGAPSTPSDLADHICLIHDAAADPHIHVINRAGKLGLGTAIVTAMRYALDNGYDHFVNMDADFSHHPRYLPALLAGMNRYDVMIGSRYVKGGGTANWPWTRELISRSINVLVRVLMRLPARDW